MAARAEDHRALPLLLVDVDGVLNPYVPLGQPLPDGFTERRLDGQRVVLSSAHGPWLHELAALFELRWATAWHHEANSRVGRAIGAPPELPVIVFEERTADGWVWKLPAVRRSVGDRPLAWLDDDPGLDVDAWAAGRDAPTLIVRTDPRVGWTRSEYDRLVEFGRRFPNGE